MKRTSLRLYSLAALLTVTLFVFGVAQEAKPAQTAAKLEEPLINLPAQYSATAFVQSGSNAGKNFGVNIYLSGVTNDGERDELLATLKHKGQDALVDAFDDLKNKGRVSPIGGTGTGMRYVRVRQNQNGGLHVVLVTNRWITFPEQVSGARSRDYPFSLVVFDVDKNGKGTGTFAPACKIQFNKRNELEIENYGQKPLRLANVRRER